MKIANSKQKKETLTVNEVSELFQRAMTSRNYFDEKGSGVIPHITIRFPELNNSADKMAITQIMNGRLSKDPRNRFIIERIEQTVTALKAS